MRACVSVCVVFLMAASAVAQSANDVAAVKARLLAEGKDLSGPCGALAITKRVAWQFRATGAGLLDKPNGNQCEGFATDIIAYPTGLICDILSDGGGVNGPQWGCGEVVDASRYRVAVDPGDTPLPVPVPQPPPAHAPLPSVDLSPILIQLSALQSRMANLDGQIARLLEQQHADTAAIRDDIKSFRDAAGSYVKDMLKYVLPLIAGIFGGKAL